MQQEAGLGSDADGSVELGQVRVIFRVLHSMRERAGLSGPEDELASILPEGGETQKKKRRRGHTDQHFVSLRSPGLLNARLT